MLRPLPLVLLAFISACDDSGKPGTPGTDTADGPSNPVDGDGDGFDDSEDCDDGDDDIHPGAVEVCDGEDNDCDDDVDEGVLDTWYSDADGDGFGDSGKPVQACDSPAGTVPNGNDCDDGNGGVFPGNVEVCNEVDDDCDGDVDEGVTPTWYADADGDGYGDPEATVDACEVATGYVFDDSDCDDSSALASPDGEEVCDGLDNDCDGDVDSSDAADASIWYRDYDGDGFGGSLVIAVACDQPEGYFDSAADCDDSDAEVNPVATEVCNGVDDDCDGDEDEGDAEDASTWYYDADRDGFGGTDLSEDACDAPSGYVGTATDCDDLAAGVYPGAPDGCDGVDNDCDGLFDEDTADLDTWYADADGDGYGDPETAQAACDEPSGYVDNDEDCDDTDITIRPGSLEVCDGADNDCDGDTDESDAYDAVTWHFDFDGDGFGGTVYTAVACDAPANYVGNTDDCDDTDAGVNPDAVEVCDSADTDEDCNGLADDADEDATGTSTFYADADGDGYGDPASTTEACDAPAGFLADATDCDDDAATVHPGASEVCDAADTDEDCDGLSDDLDSSATGKGTWYVDDDDDGYGSEADAGTALCDATTGLVDDHSDCDDTEADIHPDGVEVCDSTDTDEDCDGLINDDDPDATDEISFYLDADGDGYGNEDATPLSACSQPDGYVEDHTDCDDLDADANPGATEVCDDDDTDEDCNGLADNHDPWASGTGTWYYDADSDGYGNDEDAGTEFCDAPSRYADNNGDCNDLVAAVHPGATEICDSANTDEDCNGLSDDEDGGASGALTWYADDDGDGFGDETDGGTTVCDPASGSVTDHSDCDDDDDAIHPDAEEICDDADTDEDCDGVADDDDPDVVDAGTWYYDADGDGYGNRTGAGSEFCDPPSTWVEDNTDCNDLSAAVNPGQAEVCDARNTDEDCNGVADDYDAAATGRTTVYTDADGDGYGSDSASGADWCDPPGGTSTDNSDCDDLDRDVNPGAAEVCDALDVDEDCNGTADDADAGVSDPDSWFPDDDGDGYGDAAATAASYCDPPTGLVDEATDCDDSDRDVHPTATEVCDAADTDEDCDGLVDDADPGATGQTTWYPDGDGDGYGNTSSTGSSWCDGPTSWVADHTDCNDSAASINPGATEVCDASNTDEDCDGLADNDDSSRTGTTTWYPDVDGDGYGSDSASGVGLCDAVSGYVLNHTDCDDTNTPVHPGATEVCDAADTDEDCDGLADNDDPSATGTTRLYPDADGDGFGDETDSGRAFCDAPSGYVSDNSDCEDSISAANPGATEVCSNGVDDDCDGTPDGCAPWGTVYASTDADATLLGENSGDLSGFSMRVVGDQNGDGNDDIAIGAPYYNRVVPVKADAGRLYIINGAPSGDRSLSTADVRLAGTNADERAGTAVSGAGDVDNDGFDDVLCSTPWFGATYTGVAYLNYGPLGGSALSASDLIITGATSSLYAGWAVGPGGNINGDTYDDFLVGGIYAGSAQEGVVFVFSGGLGSGSVSTGSATATLIGEAANDWAGNKVTTAGDFDGDGDDDLLIGAPYADPGGANSGAAYLVDAPVTGTASLTSAYDIKWIGESAGAATEPVARAGDTNGDGYDDVLIGAPFYDTVATEAGVAYLVLGGLADGPHDLSTADLRIEGGGPYEYCGTDLAGDADIDGDGELDIMVSSPYDGSSISLNTGSIAVFYGPFGSGTISASTADATIYGESNYDFGGSALSTGDLDADGYDDIVFSGPSDSSYATAQGTTWVLYGLGL